MPEKPTMSKAAKVKGINDNKRQERQKERKNKTGTLLNSNTEKSNDNVTPIANTKTETKSYKLPTKLKDLLKGEDADE